MSEEQARRERWRRELKGLAVLVLVITLLVIAFVIYLATRTGDAPVLFG